VDDAVGNLQAGDLLDWKAAVGERRFQVAG
jgi:hypothetical protein